VRLVAVNAVLLLLTALAVVLFGLVARADTAIASSVRRYAAAVGASNLEAAIAEITPSQRDMWRDWISGQLGNVYEVRGVAARSPSLLQRARGAGVGGAYEVSIVLDVNRDYPTFYFQPTPRVPVEQVDGRWYLSQPPLADRGP
jgi:hypothetical protein